jgi:hypothetical protein
MIRVLDRRRPEAPSQEEFNFILESGLVSKTTFVRWTCVVWDSNSLVRAESSPLSTSVSTRLHCYSGKARTLSCGSTAFR